MFTIGQEFALPNARITLTELTPEQRPARARFDFSRPLDDANFVWLAWNSETKRFTTFQPPLEGAPVVLGGFIR